MPVEEYKSVSPDANSDPGLQNPEWALVQRIVASPGFSKSALLTKFLLYICELKLHHQEDEITEQKIGIYAFGRSPSYNPGDDNIVRSYARTLRQRLDAYFAQQGKDETLRIHIPRGSYIPHFEESSLPQESTATPCLAPTPATTLTLREGLTTKLGTSHSLRLYAFLFLMLLLAAGIFGVWRWTHPKISRFDQFWSLVLDPNRRNIVVLADSGFAILQDLTGQQVHLHEYESEDLAELFANFEVHEGKQYSPGRFKNLTSTADIHSLMNLAQLRQFAAAHPLVRHAREVRMDDISGANAIIIGGPHANPWEELYEPFSDFRLEIPKGLNAPDLDKRVMLNKHPHAGEETSYTNFDTEVGHINYGLLSFLPSIDGKGHVLLLQGGNMGATQATADFATDETSMDPILKGALGTDGTLRPFDVLLQTRVVGASSPKAHMLLVHYHDVVQSLK
jgi:hypothetical protein